MRLTKIVIMVALLAGASLAQDSAKDSAQDFPEWRSPETVERTKWKTRSLDTLDGNLLRDSSGAVPGGDSLVWVSVRLHDLLTTMMWPIEKVMTPVGRVVLDPLEEPTLYAERTEVTDRGVKLVQLDSAGKIMLYPTMVMDGGSGSRLGGTFIHRTLLGEGSYTRLGGSLMINQDWYASVNLSSPPIGELGMVPGLRVSGARSGEEAVWIPGEAPIASGKAPSTVWDERQGVELSLTIPIPKPSFGAFQPTLRFYRRDIRKPVRLVAAIDTLPDIAWFENGDRGIMGGEETWVASGFVWGRGDVNLEGTPSEGGTQSAALIRSWNKGGGDAIQLNVDMTSYFLLGEERYAYRKGDLDPYRKLSPNTILTLLDPSTLRRRLTQRRILAVQLSARRMWELEPTRDPVSFFNFPSHGGSAPARAYSGRRLMDHAVIGGSVEYRWPIWRYIDGAVFTELAWAGPEWWEVNGTGFAPGWGLGLRVRTPNQFLFRAQAAFGRETPSFLVTVSPEF